MAAGFRGFLDFVGYPIGASHVTVVRGKGKPILDRKRQIARNLMLGVLERSLLDQGQRARAEASWRALEIRKAVMIHEFETAVQRSREASTWAAVLSEV